MLRIKWLLLAVAPPAEQGKAVELVDRARKLPMAVWGELVCSSASPRSLPLSAFKSVT